MTKKVIESHGDKYTIALLLDKLVHADRQTIVKLRDSIIRSYGEAEES